jgi:small subunit ribosomal protein S16
MVRIRLMRMGATKRPFYRVVVADSRGPRDGRFIENIGKYHPLADPSIIEIDQDRALYWLSQGAQPTGQVVHLLRIQGIWERFQETKKAPKERPKSSAGSSGSA